MSRSTKDPLVGSFGLFTTLCLWAKSSILVEHATICRPWFSQSQSSATLFDVADGGVGVTDVFGDEHAGAFVAVL